MEILQKIESWRGKPGQAFGFYIFLIKKNPFYVADLQALTGFLNSHYQEESISIQQRFYHVWFDFYEIETCAYCESPRKFANIPKFSIDRYGEKPTNPVNYYKTCMSEECSKEHKKILTSQSLLKKYGSTNPMSIPGVMDKIKERNRKKYGTDFYTSTEEFKLKTKQTFLKKYGGHPTSLKETQDKKRKTNLEKYGHEHSLNNPEIQKKSKETNNRKYGGNSSMCSEEVKEKSKQTNRKKHGVDWYVQSEEFKVKFKQTMLTKYGVEQVMHYAPSFEKALESTHRKKLYVFPSGRVEKIQGYEGFALNELLNANYTEEDIVVSYEEIEKITGTIWYRDSENKRRKYYPDIFLKSENKIIEVKSEYTYRAGYTINTRKKKACLDLGLSFEFWIYDEKGNKSVK
jgi:hypothetical protein